jgi:Domain of unknown function (DUF6766)
MRWARDHSLSLVFLAMFLAALVGQAIAGHAEYNNDEIAHAQLLHQQPETYSFWRYVVSSEFGQAVMENWQSEYLQFTTFIVLTVWLVQKGSPESKKPDEVGLESDKDQKVGKYATESSPKWAHARGFRLWVLSNSLLLVMGTIWIGTWFAQSVTGWSAYNTEQLDHNEQSVNWIAYVTSADFWETTLQNWQSEFLAVGSMAVLAIYLRQRGSPESKPVGAPHEDATGSEG